MIPSVTFCSHPTSHSVARVHVCGPYVHEQPHVIHPKLKDISWLHLCNLQRRRLPFLTDCDITAAVFVN